MDRLENKTVYFDSKHGKYSVIITLQTKLPSILDSTIQ